MGPAAPPQFCSAISRWSRRLPSHVKGAPRGIGRLGLRATQIAPIPRDRSRASFKLIVDGSPMAKDVKPNQMSIEEVDSAPLSNSESPKPRVTSHLFDPELGSRARRGFR